MKLKSFISALAVVAALLSFSSCQSNTNTYTEILSEEEIAERYSTTTTEIKTIVTEETTVSTIPVTTTEEDNSIITADTREELAKGLLEAILAGDKDTAKRYGVSSEDYALMQEDLINGKEKIGLGVNDKVTASDFEIYITGPYSFMDGTYKPLESAYDKAFVYVISPTLTTVSFHFQIVYDFDLEQYTVYTAFADGTHYDKLQPRLANEQLIQ